MNTLIHYWRNGPGKLDWAILEVYGNPAPFYFGPIVCIPGAPLGMSKQMTHHCTLTEARGAAAMAGFDLLEAKPAALSITDLIAKVEADHFRTVIDTGANPNAMVVWNALRRHAGLPGLSKDDLPAFDETRGQYLQPEGSRLLCKHAPVPRDPTTP